MSPLYILGLLAGIYVLFWLLHLACAKATPKTLQLDTERVLRKRGLPADYPVYGFPFANQPAPASQGPALPAPQPACASQANASTPPVPMIDPAEAKQIAKGLEANLKAIPGLYPPAPPPRLLLSHFQVQQFLRRHRN